MYIGSADLMERNLDRRVEALCPILDPDLERYLRESVLDLYLRDDVRTWELRADGTYERVARHDPPVDAQQALAVRHSEFARESH
jgi:polyphosphate kinase